ncbi:MAG: serine/threonine protein kinase [Myxococcota bacterium]|nr:serine/threonine protein kinase [Myxococcota bacterium]
MEPERYGPYRVYEQLGEGGMATVHRAEQDTPAGIKQIALKRLTPTLDKKNVGLFLDEARLLRYLHHPNIPETYDSGRVFGTYFIAMEYIEGSTVKSLIDHCAATVGPVPVPIVLNLAGQLCDALDYAHKRCDEHGQPLKIIHRDVTPSNLIINPQGVLKLVDFGLAKATVATEPSTAGIIKGKLGYVAPEYTRGSIDHRADLWAVGIIMYELLTGRRLFDGANAFDTVSRVRELPIPRPSLGNPEVSPAIDNIVMTALERDPRQRCSSAASLRTQIQSHVSTRADAADNQAVIQWITAAFEEKRPRVKVMTPVIPLPVVSLPPVMTSTPSFPAAARWNPRTLVIACGVLLLVIGVIVAALLR